MDYKKFFTHPATITIGILLTLGLLAWVGKKYWGWFGGADGYIGGKGFPENPKVGDKHFSLNNGKIRKVIINHKTFAQ